MSRAYRIRVRESLRRVLRAEDRVTSQIEILEVLPASEMSQLLAEQLEEHGFEREGGVCRLRQEEIVVEVELATGNITVRAESSREVRLRGESSGVVYDEEGEKRTEATEKLRNEVRDRLEQDAERVQESLQKELTDQLESRLAELSGELNRIVNRVTAEALKRKAGQLGEIKEISDDPQSGSLTIVVEV